jgi:hypothetical protein
MMEPAGHGRLDDLAFVKALHPSWLRSVLRQGEVGPGTVVIEEVVTQQAAQMGFVQHHKVSGAGEFHPHTLPEPYVSLSAHWLTLPSKERDKSLGGGIPRYGSARDRGSYGLLAIAFLGAGAAAGGW